MTQSCHVVMIEFNGCNRLVGWHIASPMRILDTPSAWTLWSVTMSEKLGFILALPYMYMSTRGSRRNRSGEEGSCTQERRHYITLAYRDLGSRVAFGLCSIASLLYIFTIKGQRRPRYLVSLVSQIQGLDSAVKIIQAKVLPKANLEYSTCVNCVVNFA